jgi:hypothetical protein
MRVVNGLGFERTLYLSCNPLDCLKDPVRLQPKKLLDTNIADFSLTSITLISQNTNFDNW